MKTHTIHWKSLSNGRIGTGTFLFEKEDAERLAEELNRDYPEIHHAAIEVQAAEVELANAASPLSFQT